MATLLPLNRIHTQILDGQVKDLHVTKYGHISATVRLTGYEDMPIKLDFDDLYAIEDHECPIKLGDWLRIKVEVERYDTTPKQND